MSDPCWKDYKMVGTKKKGDKEVPNCVPEEVAPGAANAVGHGAIDMAQNAGQRRMRKQVVRRWMDNWKNKNA